VFACSRSHLPNLARPPRQRVPRRRYPHRRGRNRYPRTRFLPAFNAEFARQPADSTSAFVPVGRVDFIRSFASRTSRRNATTSSPPASSRRSLAKQPARRTCAGLRVLSATISTANAPCGTAPAVWGASPPTANRCAPPEVLPLTRAVISRCQPVAARSRINNSGDWGAVAHPDRGRRRRHQATARRRTARARRESAIMTALGAVLETDGGLTPTEWAPIRPLHDWPRV
jgi:hypothetical protein